MRYIYIAGPMAGMPDHNFPAFNAAAKLFRELGFTVLNPVEIGEAAYGNSPDVSPLDYLEQDLKLIMQYGCSSIALLPGWERSIGARLEVAYAITMDLDFFNAETGEHTGRPSHVTVSRTYGELEREQLRFNLFNHLQRQRCWSVQTFGPGERSAGVVAHIRKELQEIEASPADIEEWIDVVILAFDGAWRAGHSTEQIIAALVAKQARNESRVWPDWRQFTEGQAIEHLKEGSPSTHPFESQGVPS